MAAYDSGVEHFLKRVASRFAGLDLDEIEDLILALEQQVMKAQKNPRPFGEGPGSPGRLGAPRAAHGQFHIGLAGVRNRGDYLAGERRADGYFLMRPSALRDSR
jgi:hypothetical protein